MINRSLVFLHRWLGVAVCLFFLVWFPSGIGMMYWDFPSVTDEDRLERSAALDPSAIRISPGEALAALRESAQPDAIRLNTFDGHPVYRIELEGREHVVYADSGAIRGEASNALMERIASAWTRQPAHTASVEPVNVDQWTVQGSYRSLGSLWKYSWPNGEHVYVSQTSGEVVQYTTRASRIGAYLGPIPHWLYFTPLRSRQLAWNRVVIWTSGISTLAAGLGILIGIWMYSPTKRHRYRGAPSSIPYRGQKRWHMMLGLIFGLGAATWAFSGMLSMDPFPSLQGSRVQDGRMAQAIRGAASADALAANPREFLARVNRDDVKELELVSLRGESAYISRSGREKTRIVTLDGRVRTEFDREKLAAAIAAAAAPSALAELRDVTDYDWYYLDRRQRLPLPVILARINDAEQTRYYVDPRTAHVVGSYSSRNWTSRWLYHGLHSMNVPWLYAHRPAWDIVVIAFMLGGTGLTATAVVLAWRVVGKALS